MLTLYRDNVKGRKNKRDIQRPDFLGEGNKLGLRSLKIAIFSFNIF